MIIFLIPNLAISLRSPDLTNTRDHVIGVIRRKDMLGRPHTAVHTIVNSDIHILTIQAQPREKTLELRDFMNQAGSQVVTYIDYNGDQWKGKFISMSQITDEGDCQDTVTIQFEGTRA